MSTDGGDECGLGRLVLGESASRNEACQRRVGGLREPEARREEEQDGPFAHARVADAGGRECAN